MLDHRQGTAGVAVDDHGHIAVPFAHRGLIDQKAPSSGGCGAGSATRADQTSTRARTACQCTPWRRAAALNVITFASATSRRARRPVSAPSVGMVLRSGCRNCRTPSCAATGTNRVRRPDTPGRGRLLVAAVMPRWQRNPHCGQRQPPRRGLDAHPERARGVWTTSNTRICGKCSRTVITSQAIGALLDRDLSITDSSRASTPTQGPSTTHLPTFPRRLTYAALAITGLCDVCCLGRSCGLSRETVRRDRGWVNWAIKNSMELSTMVITRPGMMSLWCLIAVLILLNNLIIAAVVGAVYGSLRSSAHVLLVRSVSQDRGRRLVLRHLKLRRACGIVFLFVGSWVSLGSVV